MKKILSVLFMAPLFMCAQVTISHRQPFPDILPVSETQQILFAQSEDFSFGLYPNPETGYIHTCFGPNVLSIRVTEPGGKTLFSKLNQPGLMIRMQDLPAGTYFLFVEDIEHRVKVKKVQIRYLV